MGEGKRSQSCKSDKFVTFPGAWNCSIRIAPADPCQRKPVEVCCIIDLRLSVNCVYLAVA
jgi:hypothetical protein